MQNPIDVRVGKCLRDERFHIGWPIGRLAAAIGVTSTQLIEYESGEARIGASVMFEMCRVLQVPPASFFAWLPEVAPEKREAA
jgi:transcriptional regulator with XRE-family HTH domain